MTKAFLSFLEKENTNLEHAGLFKEETPLARELINLASSDYLGLSTNRAVKQAAIAAIEEHGAGISSPRMIAGTRSIHSELERALTKFLGTEDTLLYSSRYHANTGLFESLFDDRDWLFCDELAHPSLADGMRLSKARVIGYRSNDMNHLEDRLKRSRAARFRVIVTDGVVPLEGRTSDLGAICGLADRYGAQVFVDDSHGVGVIGRKGRGTMEALGVAGDVDLVTGTLTHALGAGSGGFASGRRQVIAWLRQKSRPYLLSSAPPPASTGAALGALSILEKDLSALQMLRANVQLVRQGLAEQGFELVASEHPLVMLMIGRAVATQRAIDLLYRKRVYAVGFCHPVVPEGAARIRVQVSSIHSENDLRIALEAFRYVRMG